MIVLLPIGHEETELRRFPWLTLCVVLVCTVIFVNTVFSYGDLQPRIDDARADAWAHFEMHPYLELDEAAAALIFPQLDAATRTKRLETLRHSYPHKVFDFQLAMDQPEMDRLAEALVELHEGQILHTWGLVPAQPTAAGWFGHMFHHVGWLHLLGNMLWLFVAGYILEEVWGRPIFAGLYVASGLASAFVFCRMYPELEIPLVGASGAVAGLMGAFMVRFWSTKIRFWYWFMLIFRGTFAAPAWLMLGLYFGNELLYAWLMDQVADANQGGVAHWAHVGGFAFGFVTAIGVRISGIERKYLHPALEAKVTFTDNKAVSEAIDLRTAGETDKAFTLLRHALQKDPANSVVGSALWDVAMELDRCREVGNLIAPLVKKDVMGGQLKTSLKQLKELAAHAPDARVDPLALVRLGTQLADADQKEEAAFVFEQALPPPSHPLTGPVAVRLAKAARPIDASIAARAAQSALAAADLDPQLRSVLEPLAKAAPRPQAAPEEAPAARDDGFDHSVVELSEGAPAETASTEPAATPDVFEHGVVDLADNDDGALDLSEGDLDPDTAPDEPAAEGTPFELGSTFDLSDDDSDEGGADFLTPAEPEKED